MAMQHENQDLEHTLDNIIDILSSCELEKQKGEDLLTKLNNYYDFYNRHSYSRITAKLYSISDEMILFIKMNFEELYNLFISNYTNYDNVDKMYKFFDHVALELNRLDLHNQQEIQQKSFVENIKLMLSRDMQETLNLETNRIMDEIKREVSNDLNVKVNSAEEKINTNLISVLGIFAAFITAFIAGIGAFGSIMQYLHQASKYRLVFTLFLFGLIYFDVCYALIYAVSRMTKKKIISSNIDELEPRIEGFWAYIRDRIKRYPLFFGFNTIMILGIIIITFMYFNQSMTESVLGFID